MWVHYETLLLPYVNNEFYSEAQRQTREVLPFYKPQRKCWERNQEKLSYIKPFISAYKYI